MEVKKVANMSSKIDSKIGIEKSSFRGGPVRRNFGELGGRRGVRGEVNVRPGGRRPGRKEVKEVGR